MRRFRATSDVAILSLRATLLRRATRSERMESQR